MKKPRYLVAALAVVVAVSFLAGSWYHSRKTPTPGAAGGRKILHYVDPMNPAHTSPKPGLAPCGMQMEPVYADDGGQMPSGPLPPGSVKVSPQKQQMIGVRVAPVEKAPFTFRLRALGKVAVDETRIFRLNAAIDGWIREVGNNSTGSVVKKGEYLATFYSPEFLSAQQAYIYVLGALDRFQASGAETSDQQDRNTKNIQQAVDALNNLGMSDLQIEEIAKTRQYTETIRMVAPATSFVLARNISAGQRFDKGTEWYRLADLSRVWVLADLFENEADYIKPGEKVKVTYPYQKKTFQAKVSQVLPIFDPATRTLKVRLELDNPDYLLRPDMFVDVEFPIQVPSTVSVPADAVLDSGLKKTVFVDVGNGYFEPRKVETGLRLGDRVEILAGLQPGEKIVVSGNFLIDSESRMKLAAAGFLGAVVKDPVCGNDLDEGKAKSAGRKSDYQGKAYYFCSDGCQQKFDQTPERFAANPGMSPAQAQEGMVSSLHTSTAAEKKRDPVGGIEADQDRAKAEGLTGTQAVAPQSPASTPNYMTAPVGRGNLPPGTAGLQNPPAGPPKLIPPTTGETPGAPIHGETPRDIRGRPIWSPPIKPEGNLAAVPDSAMTAEAIPKAAAMSPAPAMPMGGHPAQPKAMGPRDPVCGHEVEESQAKAAGLTSEFRGKAYYFCSYACNKLFDKDPERYLGQKPATPKPAMPAATPSAPLGPVSVAPPVQTPPKQPAPQVTPAPMPAAPQPAVPVSPPGHAGQRHD